MTVNTRPEHWLDLVLWPLLKISWEKIFRQNAHFWHWQNKVPFIVRNHPQVVRLPFHSDYEIVVLRTQGTYAENCNDFQIGCYQVFGGCPKICSLVLNERVGVKKCAAETHFFAVSRYYEIIPITIDYYIYKGDKIPNELIVI